MHLKILFLKTKLKNYFIQMFSIYCCNKSQYNEITKNDHLKKGKNKYKSNNFLSPRYILIN